MAAVDRGLCIGKRLRILAPGARAVGDGRIELVLAHGAFGSGEHETTSSCLEILEGLGTMPGARVLDLGSGTGVLAIAALALGASAAVCVDIAASAVEAARRNCEANSLSDRVQHVTGTLADVDAGERFDLVLANIHGDILIAVAAELVRRTRCGGTLLLSGILWEDACAVRECYLRLGCTVGAERWMETYCTIVLRAPDALSS